MPERRVTFAPGHYYHIYNRGNNRGGIFFEDENYLFFLRRWRKWMLPYVDIIAYCLMPTHYHFLVRIKDRIDHDQTSEVSKTSEVSEVEVSDSEAPKTSDISKGMQKLAISYTKAINKRFERVGALFQGAYRAKMIESEKYLIHLCRYIHANPVKDGLVDLLDDWLYSNYLEWVGERDGSLYNQEFVRDYFPDPGDYISFVNDFVETRRLPDEIMGYLSYFE
jgi:REP element-mobilizing transposase RayT